MQRRYASPPASSSASSISMSWSRESSTSGFVKEQLGDFGFAGDERADWCEGAAVQGAGTQFAQLLAMLWRAVALVRGQAVAGVLRVQFAHQAVAVDLGDDGGGSDGERERVAVKEARLGAGVVEPHGVDEQMIRHDRERLDRGEHGDARGLVDVDAVDGLGVDLGDRDSDGDLADAAVELLAVLAGELLGILQAGAGKRA